MPCGPAETWNTCANYVFQRHDRRFLVPQLWFQFIDLQHIFNFKLTLGNLWSYRSRFQSWYLLRQRLLQERCRPIGPLPDPE
jgi:hypothetical protein